MIEATTDGLLAWLRARGDCEFGPGLTPAELDDAQDALRVVLPPAWRALLRTAHPRPRSAARRRYPDWRHPRSVGTAGYVDAPADGLLFDVEHNDLWWHAWGLEPADPAARTALARERLARVPRLCPIAGHLYAGPTDDDPVFSIVQADVWVAAPDLGALVRGESQDTVPVADWPIGTVPFWSELHAWSQRRDDPRFAGLARGGL